LVLQYFSLETFFIFHGSIIIKQVIPPVIEVEVVGIIGVDALEVRNMFIEPLHIPILGTAPFAAVHPAGFVGVVIDIRVVLPLVGKSKDIGILGVPVVDVGIAGRVAGADMGISLIIHLFISGSVREELVKGAKILLQS
jgi:hypothetical protein